MTSSMTAFAHVEESHGTTGIFVWEIRTVNYRYLDIGFRLPDGFRKHEPFFREKIKSVISRGKVECHLSVTHDAGTRELVVNSDKLGQLKQALSQISASFPDYEKGRCTDILAWPDVVVESGVEKNDVSGVLIDTFNRALSQVVEVRNQEGKQLQQFVHKRMELILEYLNQLKKNRDEIIEKQNEKLLTRCRQIVVDVDAARIEQEVALLALKSDISEEIDRLSVHVEEVVRVLQAEGCKGRRLDFLMQELNREINTVAAKSASSALSQAAIQVKVLVEQAREQIQNIE